MILIGQDGKVPQQIIEKYFEKSGSEDDGKTVHYDLKYDYYDDGDLVCVVNDRTDLLCLTVKSDGSHWIHSEDRGEQKLSPEASLTFMKRTICEEDDDQN